MTTNTKPSRTTLGAAVKQLSGLCNALSHLSTTGVERLSVIQVLFFTLVARAEALGHNVTLRDLMEDYEDILNKSIRNTYKIFLDKNLQYPDSLGWITRVPNPDDERENFLKLTGRGRKVAETLLLAMNGGDFHDGIDTDSSLPG